MCTTALYSVTGRKYNNQPNYFMKTILIFVILILVTINHQPKLNVNAAWSPMITYHFACATKYNRDGPLTLQSSAHIVCSRKALVSSDACANSLRARSLGGLLEQSVELQARVVGQPALRVTCNIIHCKRTNRLSFHSKGKQTCLPPRLNVLRRAASFLFFSSSIVASVVTGYKHRRTHKY